MSALHNVRMQSDVLREVIKKTYPQLRDENVEVLLSKVMVDSKVLKLAADVLKGLTRRVKRKIPVITVANAISAEDDKYLRDSFKGHVDFVSTVAEVYSPHPVMLASRRAAFACIKQHLAGSQRKRIVTAGEDASWVSSQLKGWNVVANYAPVLSARDDATRNLAVRRKVRTKGQELTFDHIMDKMENADVTADIVITRDVYDASITDRARCMDRVGALVQIYSIMVPEDYYERKLSGTGLTEKKLISGANVRYWFDRDVNPRTVSFDMSDGSLPYTHSCEVYESQIHPTSTTTDCAIYHCSRIARHGIYCLFKMVRVKTECPPPLFHVERVSPIATVKVEIFRHVGGDRGNINNYQRGHFITMIASDFNRMVTAMITDIRSKDPKMFQSAVRIFNGVVRSTYIVSADTRSKYLVSTGDLPMLVVSMLCYAFRLKAITSDRIKDATKLQHLKRQLETGGTFSMFNVSKAVRDVMTSFSIATHSLKTAVKNSPFLNKVLDIISLEHLNNILGLGEITLFTPEIIEGGTEVRNRFSSRHMKYYHTTVTCGAVDTKRGDFSEDLADDDVLDADVDTVKLDQHLADLRVLRAIDESDAISFVDTDESTAVEAQPTLTREHYDSMACQEYLDLCSSILQDKLEATNRTSIVMSGWPTDRLPQYVRETWSEASNDQQQVVVFEVRNNAIVSAYPSEMLVNHTAMYAFPTNSTSFSFDHKSRLNVLVKKGTKVKTPDGRYFSFKEISIFPEPQILEQAASLSAWRNDDLSVQTVLNEAVAGHGKTYNLVNSYWRPGCIVLCNGSTNREEILSDLKVKYPDVDPRRVRTIDSFLMRPDKDTEHLIVDEFFMIPYGKIVLARKSMRLKGKKLLEVDIGDRPQIPFINRSRKFLQYQNTNPDVESFHTAINFGDDSKRVSRSQAHIVQQFYPLPIYTTSKVKDAVAYKRISSIEQVPLLDHVLYLTYTQKTKSDFLIYARRMNFTLALNSSDKGCNAMLRTVHESQGMTAQAVIIIRSENSNQVLWDSESHALVALTRATHATLFCSIKLVKEDLMHRCCLDTVSERQMNARIKLDSDVVLHKEDSCRCGGSKHPLVGMVKQYRSLNAIGKVSENEYRR